MEVYDTANKLAEEIRNSKEFLEFKEAREQIKKDPEKEKKIEDFESLRYEVQILTVKKQDGEDIDITEKDKKLQQLYMILIENKDIKEYFDKEIAFNIMLTDVNKIIGDSVKELL